MTATAGRTWCPACQGLAGTLPVRGLAHWFLVTEPTRHYLATRPAIRSLRGTAPPPTVLARIDAIAATSAAAWIDVSEHGEVVVYQAPHGVIPVDLPRLRPPSGRHAGTES